jgi:hypothetical protein
VTLERSYGVTVEVKARGRELPPLAEIAAELTANLALECEEPDQGWVPCDAKAALAEGRLHFPRVAKGRYRL